jgi:hypothetical protein
VPRTPNDRPKRGNAVGGFVAPLHGWGFGGVPRIKRFVLVANNTI